MIARWFRSSLVLAVLSATATELIVWLLMGRSQFAGLASPLPLICWYVVASLALGGFLSVLLQLLRGGSRHG